MGLHDMGVHSHKQLTAAFCCIGAIATVLLAEMSFAQGIYSCTDANGRSYLSDKRIPECIDVVQKELGKSGIMKRQITPETHLSKMDMNGSDLGTDPAKEKALRDMRQQKALLDRYASESIHTQERKRALATVDESINYINNQTNTHLIQRQVLVQEQAAYKTQQQTIPAVLQQKISETEALLVLLRQQLSDRMYERQRVNQRFDSELIQLRPLWGKTTSSQVSK